LKKNNGLKQGKILTLLRVSRLRQTLNGNSRMNAFLLKRKPAQRELHGPRRHQAKTRMFGICSVGQLPKQSDYFVMIGFGIGIDP